MSDIRQHEARLRADLARDRFLATAGALRDRLSPASAARHAADASRAKAVALADTVVDGVAARPAAALGAGAILTAWLLRRPALRLLRGSETGRRATRSKTHSDAKE